MKDNGGTQWDLKPLSDVADVVYGTRVVKQHDQGTKYPVYGGGGATFSVDQTNRSDCMIVARFGMSEECVRFVGGDFFLNDSGLTVESRDQTYLAQEFLDVQLLGRQAKIYALGRGTAQKNLDVSAFKNLPIVIPPLEEQKRIVAVLDEAFEGLARARAHAEANLQNARDLFGSTLQAALQDEAISWNDTALSDLGAVVTGSTPKTAEKGNLGNHVPFVKPGDFLPDGSLVYDNQGLSEQGAAVSRVLPAGSALMVCIGATIGKAGYSDRPITTNQQINAVVPKDGISGEYLYYQMLTPELQADVMRRAGQATLPIINKGKWSKLTVRMPSDLSKQAEIVDKLSKIRGQVDAASAQYELQILDLGDLRQSLLQKAFAGELT